MSSSNPDISGASIKAQLDTLVADFRDFNSSIVPIENQPSAVEFSKMVAHSQPTVFRVSQKGYPPFAGAPWRAQAWNRAYLDGKVKQPIEVALTPYGNADALVTVKREQDKDTDPHKAMKAFVQPATRQMLLAELFDRLVFTHKNDVTNEVPVAYLQSQNNNLYTHALECLREDLPENFPFAQDVLGEPDAVNLWIGDSRSVTSIHRDPYENLYLVLRGSKTFRLWAPVDEVHMPTSMVRTGRYEYSAEIRDGRQFNVVMDEDSDRIPWVDLDPLASDFMDPGTMRQVTVEQGQMLYLPSGWYHHVTQECGKWDDGSAAPCIAVNYWYDMDYSGERYAMRQLVSRLVDMVREHKGSP